MSHLLRTICLVIAMTLYFLAIARIPLATAVSAFFVGPIVAVALALVVLKERVTLRKIASLVLALPAPSSSCGRARCSSPEFCWRSARGSSSRST